MHKEGLSLELQRWLQGRILASPCVIATSRIEKNITRFVKYGNTPLQTDLIMWILSRTELVLTQGDDHELTAELIFGGSEREKRKIVTENTINEYPNNVRSALPKSRLDPTQAERSHEKTMDLRDSAPFDFEESRFSKTSAHVLSNETPIDDLGTLAATTHMLGRSAALQLVGAKVPKKRPEAKPVIRTFEWSAHHAQLAADLVNARKGIEKTMELRRQVLLRPFPSRIYDATDKANCSTRRWKWPRQDRLRLRRGIARSRTS